MNYIAECFQPIGGPWGRLKNGVGSNRYLSLRSEIVKICFYAANSLPIHAKSLEERPLGGTETGVIRVAAELSKKGHQVFVVTSHSDPLPFNSEEGPYFIPENLLRQAAPFDVLVAVQHWRSLFLGIPARRKFFWTGDGYEQFSNWGIGDLRVSKAIDALIAVSSWQAETLAARGNFPLDKIRIVGNGIHPPYFEGEEKRERMRILYTSAPYRGLELAAKYFELIRDNFPEAEFHVFAGLSIYDTNTPFRGPQVQQFKELSKSLSAMPGVTLHGNVLQSELAREYMKSSVLLYPNVIEETFCITALEAQAGGCPVIASDISALPETVGTGGFVIPGEIGGEEYSRNLILALGKLLTDDALWNEVSESGKQRALGEYSWLKVAERIEAVVA